MGIWATSKRISSRVEAMNGVQRGGFAQVLLILIALWIALAVGATVVELVLGTAPKEAVANGFVGGICLVMVAAPFVGVYAAMKNR